MFVESGRERLTVVLDLCDQNPASEHERRRHSEAIAGVRVIQSHATQPLEVSIEVETEQVIRRKDREQTPAIGHRRGAGDTGFVVAHRAAHRPKLALPNHRAVGSIEAENLQPVLTRATAGGDKYPVTHDERA